MNSSDSAEEFVKICLDGIDHAIRIMGVGAKKHWCNAYCIK